MSDPNKWDPADGPPPTEEELEEAHALSAAIDAGKSSRSSAKLPALEPATQDLLEVALRVHATAHPDAEHIKSVTSAAVTHALESAGNARRWARWRWAAAAGVLLLVGAGAGIERSQHRPPRELESVVSRPAARVFDAPLGRAAGSAPISRITDVRSRSYRDALFRVATGGAQ